MSGDNQVLGYLRERFGRVDEQLAAIRDEQCEQRLRLSFLERDVADIKVEIAGIKVRGRPAERSAPARRQGNAGGAIRRKSAGIQQEAWHIRPSSSGKSRFRRRALAPPAKCPNAKPFP
jgi:hypothetical protein